MTNSTDSGKHTADYRMQQAPAQTSAQNRACWERDMREIGNFIKASEIGPIKDEWLAAIAKATGSAA